MGNFRDNYTMRALLLWMDVCPCCWSGYIITEMGCWSEAHNIQTFPLCLPYRICSALCFSCAQRPLLDVLTFCSLRNTEKQIYV